MKDDNWDDYRFVLALAQHGSIAAAACALHVAETTVARRLLQIEAALDTRLFDRERGRVVPTAHLERLMARLLRVRDDMHALRDEASGDNERLAGSVRVTAVPMIANRVIVPELPAFLARHDALTLELLVDSAVLSITDHRAADIAIRGRRPATDPAAITRKIGEMEYGVYCHERLITASAAPRWIGYTNQTTGRTQANWIDARLAEAGQQPTARVNDAESLLHCLLVGLGMSLIPVPLAQRYPQLVRLPSHAPEPEREFWMVMHPSCREVRRMSVVAAWLTEVVGAFLTTGCNGDDGGIAVATGQGSRSEPVSGPCPRPEPRTSGESV